MLSTWLAGMAGRAAGAIRRAGRGRRAGLARRAGRGRRGSFLVLVVGTLALLAVITIVYVGIGSQDTRLRGAVQQRQRLDTVPDQVRDYIGSIIADDVLASSYALIGTDGVPFRDADDRPYLLRESSDYPWTDPTRRSNIARQGTPGYFSPVGTASPDVDGVWPNEVAVPSDPWLASAFPTRLNYPDAAGNLPPGSTPPWTTINPLGGDFLDQRDWLKISNISPSGGFVNLGNLAPVNGADRVPNFRAESGLGSDKFGLPRLGENLTLWDANDLSGLTTSRQTDYRQAANPVVPFHWDSRQAWAFRPANPGTSVSAQEDHYPPHQWADTDGDGFMDARWFEMVDARDENNVRNLLETDPRFRYFIAARIVDLSALINVNTATDLLAAPTADAPLGLTPADVDLRRWLTMQDSWDVIAPRTGSAGVASAFAPALYNAIPSPATAAGLQPDNLAGGAPGGLAYDLYRARRAGEAGYWALRLAIASGQVPSLINPLDPTDPTADRRGNALLNLATSPASPGTLAVELGLDTTRQWQWNTITADGARSRRRIYERFASDADRSFGLARRGATGALATQRDRVLRFGPEELSELLTFRGANDPSVASALERAIDGRMARGAAPFLSEPVESVAREYTKFSPMRSQRSAAWELSRDDDLDGDAGETEDGDGFASAQARLQQAVDVRQGLTTLSGARQFRSSLVADPRSLGVADLKIDAADLAISSDRTELIYARNWFDQARWAFGTDVQTLFRGYADALLPLSAVPGAWSAATQGGGGALSTLFYGHRGPETAMVMATHMALNFKDLADNAGPVASGGSLPTLLGIDQPTAVTLLLDQDARLWAEGDVSTWRPGEEFYRWSFEPWRPLTPAESAAAGGADDPRRRRLLTLGTEDDGRYANSGGRTSDVTTAKAMNVFGVEPHPVITGVGVMTVYIDAPDATPGLDSDSRDLGDTSIKIDPSFPTATRTNPDFLFRAVAFQLHNPFGRDVTLSQSISWSRAGTPGTGELPETAQALRTAYGASNWTGVGPPVPTPTATQTRLRENLLQVDVSSPASPALNRADDFFYVEFGGRRFMLTAMVEQPNVPGGTSEYFPPGTNKQITTHPIRIPAGQSVVVVALSQTPRAILARLEAVENAHPGRQIAATTDGPGVFNEPAYIRRIVLGALAHNFDSGPEFVVGSADASPVDGIPDLDTVFWIPEVVDVGGGAAPEWRALLPDGTGSSATRPVISRLLADADPGASPPVYPTANAEVLVWRAMRSPLLDGATQAVSLPPTGFDGALAITPASVFLRATNSIENDLLVDRFRVPRVTVPSVGSVPLNLDARLRVPATGDPVVSITGTTPGTDEYAEDNTGYTIAVYAGARRPADPSVENFITQTGGVWPASREDWPLQPGQFGGFAIEPKVFFGGGNWNRYDSFPFSGTERGDSLRQEDFASRADPVSVGRESFRDFFEDLIDDPSDSFPPFFAVSAPAERRGTRPGATGESPVGLNLDNIPYQLNTPFVAHDNGEFRVAVTGESRLRGADLLLPLAVGPTQRLWSGAASATPTSPGPISEVWTTLGESLATALGYTEESSLPEFDIATLYTPVRDISGLTTTNPPRPVGDGWWSRTTLTDRGNLRLDDFAPFIDNVAGGPSGDFAEVELDRRAWLGTPMALNVLDVFSVLSAVRPSGTSAVPGLINVNTAPLPILRTLPLLSPTMAADSLTATVAGDIPNEWWFTAPTTGVGAIAPFETITPQADVAATVAAYRDKVPMGLRFESMPDPAEVVRPELGTVWFPWPFARSNVALDRTVRVEFRDEDQASVPVPPVGPELRGREITSDINGIREQPGLAHIGELQAARYRYIPDVDVDDFPWRAAYPNSINFAAVGAAPLINPSNSITAPNPPNWALPANFDATGFDFNNSAPLGPGSADPRFPPGIEPGLGFNNSRAGLDSINLAGSATSPANRVANEFGEQLIRLNAVANLASVRSDYFVAWFMVAGFQESDVTGLSAEDPLSPTVLRRFVAVYDRSNVTGVGQQPRLVLFRELPVERPR